MAKDNNKILNQLIKFVKEQHKMNIEQHKMNINAEKRLRLHYIFLTEQREWLKNHEIRLKNIEE